MTDPDNDPNFLVPMHWHDRLEAVVRDILTKVGATRIAQREIMSPFLVSPELPAYRTYDACLHGVTVEASTNSETRSYVIWVEHGANRMILGREDDRWRFCANDADWDLVTKESTIAEIEQFVKEKILNDARPSHQPTRYPVHDSQLDDRLYALIRHLLTAVGCSDRDHVKIINPIMLDFGGILQHSFGDEVDDGLTVATTTLLLNEHMAIQAVRGAAVVRIERCVLHGWRIAFTQGGRLKLKPPTVEGVERLEQFCHTSLLVDKKDDLFGPSKEAQLQTLTSVLMSRAGIAPDIQAELFDPASVAGWGPEVRRYSSQVHDLRVEAVADSYMRSLALTAYRNDRILRFWKDDTGWSFSLDRPDTEKLIPITQDKEAAGIVLLTMALFMPDLP